LKQFKLALEAMGNQQYDEAANQFLDSRWAKQVGNRAIELAEMIRTGEYQKDYK
jgi:lysozyme